MQDLINKYKSTLINSLELRAFTEVPVMAESLKTAWSHGRNVFLCGNGGSAGNAIHLANDFIYGVGTNNGIGIRAEALSANSAVITCLANDISYDKVFAEQLKVKGNKDDILIALSGSGNSPNIINAINTANEMDLKTFAILGFDGGEVKKIAKCPIHFEVNDMQVSEDLQLIVGHMCMQWLNSQKIKFTFKQ